VARNRRTDKARSPGDENVHFRESCSCQWDRAWLRPRLIS
jgi:hypothetical protein